MNNEVLLLIEKHTDILIEQTKIRPQETLENKKNKEMETFSFNPPINLAEEGKWLSAVPFSEITNSVFYIPDENNSFLISIPNHCNSGDGEDFVNKLNNLFELRSENDNDLYVEQVKKRGKHLKLGGKDYKLSDLGTGQNDINKDLRNIEYKNL